MKSSFTYGIIICLLLISCGSRENSTIEPTEQEIAKVKKIAMPIAGNLMESLRQELLNAMQLGGPLNAIEVCQARALPLTSEIAKNAEYSVELKRLSRKNRNPKNAPDSIDEIILTQFENFFAQNEKMPSEVIHKRKGANGNEFYYYKPIMTSPLCLNCHGDLDAMDDALVEKLRKVYPKDKATGYKDGELRGLIRVKITGEL